MLGVSEKVQNLLRVVYECAKGVGWGGLGGCKHLLRGSQGVGRVLKLPLANSHHRVSDWFLPLPGGNLHINL